MTMINLFLIIIAILVIYSGYNYLKHYVFLDLDMDKLDKVDKTIKNEVRYEQCPLVDALTEYVKTTPLENVTLKDVKDLAKHIFEQNCTKKNYSTIYKDIASAYKFKTWSIFKKYLETK